MCLFEGNSSILNLYAEVDQPKHFLKYTLASFVIIMILCIGCGTLSYLTFGQKIEDIVLLNLPESNLADITKMLYLLTIMGSYVILIQPVF
jgi:proton-coupled amino acid transporter